jgi:gamma-glutamylputrescine oxidase
MNLSYWEKESFFKNIDTLVIGGGIVGLSTAIYLKQRSPLQKVVVAERDVFSAGASTKNAGFACFGSAGELLDDLQKMKEDEVFTLVKRRYDGLQNLRNLLGDKSIEYDGCGGYELFTENEMERYQACLAGLDYLNNHCEHYIGHKPYQAIDPTKESWPFKGIKAAIVNPLEGGIHTGEMMKALTQKARESGVEIMNGITIDSVVSGADSPQINLGEYSFKVRQIAICTNGFARQLMPELEVLPARNQVVVTEKIPGLNFRGTFHMNKGYIYFRNIDERILLGGFRHTDLENEFTHEFGLTEKIQSELESFLHQTLLPQKDIKIEHRWSGIMGLGNTKTTIVKEAQPGIFVGVRMGGMGVAIGTLVGKELAALMY